MIFLEIILHLEQHLTTWTQAYGAWVYGLAFLVVFCETGLVVLPFLPGDSLLFVLGSLTVLSDSPLSIWGLSLTLIGAAFLGDNCNYFVGRKLGEKVFAKDSARFLNPQNLQKTKDFYERNGSKAVILARFVPLIRTFVPFVAGVGHMNYKKYLGYSALGSLFWTQTFLWAGATFGNLPYIKRNFEVVILAVIGISLIPAILGIIKEKRQKPIAQTKDA
jgi:membrane-associated protein